MFKMKKEIIVFVFLILIFGTFFVIQYFKEKVIKFGSEEHDLLVENCECIERENLFCPDGFELEERICVGDGKFTNVQLGCSKYDCDGKIKEVKK